MRGKRVELDPFKKFMVQKRRRRGILEDQVRGNQGGVSGGRWGIGIQTRFCGGGESNVGTAASREKTTQRGGGLGGVRRGLPSKAMGNWELGTKEESCQPGISSGRKAVGKIKQLREGQGNQVKYPIIAERAITWESPKRDFEIE